VFVNVPAGALAENAGLNLASLRKAHAGCKKRH
jgi:hypothetical protein